MVPHLRKANDMSDESHKAAMDSITTGKKVISRDPPDEPTERAAQQDQQAKGSENGSTVVSHKASADSTEVEITQRAAQQDGQDFTAAPSPEGHAAGPAVAALPQEEISDDEIGIIGAECGLGRLPQLLDDDQWNEIEPMLIKFARRLLAAAPQEVAPKGIPYRATMHFDDETRVQTGVIADQGAPREAQEQATRSLSRLYEYAMQHAKGNTGLREGIKGDHQFIKDALRATPSPSGQWVSVEAEIASERKRQIEVEAWDAEHDDLHDTGGLAMAAACYAAPAPLYKGAHIIRPVGDRDGFGPQLVLHDAWPWEPQWWKPKGRRRDLIRAAALIVAEIERLDRAALPASPEGRKKED